MFRARIIIQAERRRGLYLENARAREDARQTASQEATQLARKAQVCLPSPHTHLAPNTVVGLGLELAGRRQNSIV
jgi:hypothetical protein